MVAVFGDTPFAMLEIHLAISTVALLTGRDSLMFEYLMRVGSCQTK